MSAARRSAADSSDDVARRITAAQAALGVTFFDSSLLERALTHPSFAAESPSTREHYERLEFLGDAVLSFVVADHLFHAFPTQPEGLLTKLRISLVAGTVLTQVAEDLGLGKLLLVGRGAETAGARQRILEDLFEAVVGALYLDQGLDAARVFVLRAVANRIDLDAAERLTSDPKTALQELTQGRGLGLPKYRIVREEGPPHEREFVSEVLVNGRSLGAGSGTSKKDAEKRAAEEALITLREG